MRGRAKRQMKSLDYPECYGLFSGGKDSSDVLKVLKDAKRLKGAIAFDTGIKTPEWLDHVGSQCDAHNIPLKIYKTPESFEAFVMKNGYPGPGWHGRIMNMLKGRAVRLFKKDHPDGVLASGVRSEESDRRTLNTKPVSIWENVPVMAPIFNWTTDETWSFFHESGFVRSPAYSTLQISGDCLCGAYACEGEREAMEFHYPEIGKFLRELGEAVKDKFPNRHEWGWGWKKPLPKKRSVAEKVGCVDCALKRDLFPDTLNKSQR